MVKDTSEKEKFKPFMPKKAPINAEWMGNLKKSQAIKMTIFMPVI